jgi:hypothetical protein
LGFTLEDALGLKGAEDLLLDEKLGQGRGFGPRGLRQELADHLIELSPVDQSAAPQVPDEPFTGA